VPSSNKHPQPFLTVRVQRADLVPGLVGVCAGYELKEWRCEQLVSHLVKWLPEFALRHSELAALGPENAVELVARAAQVVYTSNKYQQRGEIGELLLHIVMRQVFHTLPAISRYFFKDASNDTVKGFDGVHVVASDNALELWLGEAKFYEDIGEAIRNAVKSLQQHANRDYLRAEFAAITNKVDDSWPHATRLKKLIQPETSLDDVFDAMCVPVLLTYESPTIASHESVSHAFQASFEKEVLAHRDAFAGKSLPDNLRIHLFLFPMKAKGDLLARFDAKLKACQAIA
jgi:hypothetical protein